MILKGTIKDYDEKQRAYKYLEQYATSPNNANRVLFTWIKTGVISQSTFKVIMNTLEENK